MVMLMLLLTMSAVFVSVAAHIPLDAVEFNGHYYKVYYNSTIGWHDAKTACEELGGHLATITNEEEDEFIYSLVSKENIECWLGGTDEITEGVWKWVTGEEWIYQNAVFDNCQNVQHYLVMNYEGIHIWDDQSEKEESDNGLLCGTEGYVCEWENIYNIGEETYSFDNYVDRDSTGGHCYGMSMTSAGYYLGFLDPVDVGANSSREIYDLSESSIVREPICTYQAIQGSIRNKSMVAGGTNYKTDSKFDIKTDWNEVVNYVKNHEYDNRGTLQIGYRKSGEGGHAINFLRYEVVDGQERIYAYDNNEPTKETYFYQDKNGNVRQAVYSTFSGNIDCITLRHIPTYFEEVSKHSKNMIKFWFYAIGGNVIIGGALSFIMDINDRNNEYYMYELPENTTTVKIIPLVDNATFTYMGQEYSFGEIDEDTYAEFTLATSKDDVPIFEIINAPEEEPEVPDEPEAPDVPDISDTPDDPCSCKCHGNFIQRLIFKITNFFQKLFGKNKVCTCGVKH